MRTDAYRQHTGEGSADFGKDAKRIKHIRNCLFALSCGCEALRIGTYRLSEQTQALEMNLKERRKPWALPGTEHPPAKATPRRSAVSGTAAVQTRHGDVWPDGVGEEEEEATEASSPQQR